MDPYIRDYEINTHETSYLSKFIDLKSYNLSHHLKFLQINIRSIEKNIDELKIHLKNMEEEFHVIVLTETFKVSDPQIFGMVGYSTIYNEGVYNRNDGVIVFVREDLQFDYSIIAFGDIKAVEVNMKTEENSIKLTCIYRSPHSCPSVFNINLYKYLERTERADYHILTGDLNINILANNDFIAEYLNIVDSFGFVSYINKSTRPSSGTCLDHFFVKSKNPLQADEVKSFIVNTNITDHYPIILCLKGSELRNQQQNVKTRKYIDYDALKTDLEKIDWYSSENTLDVDKFATELFTKIYKYINKNTVTVRINTKKTGKKGWITTGLLKSINRKNELYLRTTKYPNNQELKLEYIAYRNQLHRLIRTAKKRHLQDYMHKTKSSTKALWNFVSDICNQSKSETDISHIEVGGRQVTEREDVAEAFNEYFSGIGKEYADKIREPKEFEEHENFLEETIFLYPTDSTEVKKVISDLKEGKAPGIDGIRSTTLKQIKDQVSEPIAYLINLCFEQGSFPKIFKTAIIKPLHKAGSRTNIQNYRPISLISNFGKIIEKIIKTRMTQFLEKHEIIAESQHGFRKGKSTRDAIFELTDGIYKLLDQKRAALCIFIDLAKAFDTVSHEKLLRKLYVCGFRGKSYDLFESYLKNRKQIVEIEGYQSKSRSVTFGVPQGTVLGPVLFLVYMNSLLLMRQNGKIISFADDTAILYTNGTWKGLKRMVEVEFKKIKNWFKYNKLTLNIEKTKYITFVSYRSGAPNFGCLRVDEETCIPEATEIKYLGITIDQNLRWDKHINNVVKKLRGLLYKFRYLKKYLDIPHLRQLYFSLVQSQLTYGIIGWGGAYDTHMNKVETLQKWILKIMYGKPLIFPSNEIYQLSGMLEPYQLFTMEILTNIFSGKLPVNLRNHPYSTREKTSQFESSIASKRVGQRSGAYLAPRIYATLPENIRKIKNFSTFKKQTKQWIFETGREVNFRIINSS